MIDYDTELEALIERPPSKRWIASVVSSKLFGNHWLFITGALLFISLITRQVPLLLVALLFFFTGGVARLWEHYCLARVEYRRRLSANRVFFGDEVQLEVEVTNGKLLPLPWIDIDDELPEGVTVLKGKTSPSSEPERVFLPNLLSLNWYHKVKRRYPMRCLQRGYFVFGPARVRSGDLFGVFDREMIVQREDFLMVYPRIVPLEKLGIPSKQPFGDIRTKRHIFQDPNLNLGVRGYASGDNLKHIHWKASARLGRLQTKVYETTTTVDMGIFLDVRTMPFPYLGSLPRRLELAIITAASIAKYAIDEGFRVGLYANQRKIFPDEPIRIPPSQHKDQLTHILEALAQIKPYEMTQITRVIAGESRSLPWGSAMVVISAFPTESLLSTLVHMKRAGRRVVLIQVGVSPLNAEEIISYHVSDDVAWSDLEAVAVREV